MGLSGKIGTVRRFIGLAMAFVMVAGLCVSGFAAEEPVKAKTYKYGPKIEEWAKANSDIRGWVYIDGTNINYPVVYPGKEKGNNYYMSRGYKLEQSRNSVIWADKNVKTGAKDEISKNTVLYGHNWTNIAATPRIGNQADVMMAQLPSFHHLSFAQEHQFINYSTADANMVYQVFAVFYTEVDLAYNTANPDAKTLKSIIKEVRDRSLHDYEIEVSEEDYIVTMSTCTRAYGSSNQQRFVVMAKRVSAGTELVKVTANADFKKPSLKK